MFQSLKFLSYLVLIISNCDLSSELIHVKILLSSDYLYQSNLLVAYVCNPQILSKRRFQVLLILALVDF